MLLTINSLLNKAYHKNFKHMRNKHGSAIIEFALLFPVFLLLMFAVIVFGYWFIIYEANGRAVSAIAHDISGTSYAQQQSLFGGGPQLPNYIAHIAEPLIGYNGNKGLNDGLLCVRPWATLAQAQNDASSGACGSQGEWSTLSPTGNYNSGPTYYVAIRATVTINLPLSAMFKWMKDNKKTMTFTQNTVATVKYYTPTPQREWTFLGNWNSQPSITSQNVNNYPIIVQFSDPGNSCGNRKGQSQQSGDDYNGGIELYVSPNQTGPWNPNSLVSYWSQGKHTSGGTVSTTVPPGWWYYINCDRYNFDQNSHLAVYQ